MFTIDNDAQVQSYFNYLDSDNDGIVTSSNLITIFLPELNPDYCRNNVNLRTLIPVLDQNY